MLRQFVGHPVVHPIISCVAHLYQVDSLLPPEGFLTGALVVHIGLPCSWEHHEVRFACLQASSCLLQGSTHLGRQCFPVVLD